MFRMRKSKICKIKRYFSPTLVKKVTILYLFIIIIPAVIFMSYLYNMSKRNVYEHFYSERAKIEKEILNSFESDYSRYDYMAKLVRSDEIIKNLLQPGLLKDGEKVEYILRYTDSMFNHSLRIDPFIEEVCIYYTKKQLFDVEHSFYDVAWIKDEPWYHTLMDDPYYDNSRWMFHVTHKRSDRTTTSVFLKLYDNYYAV